MTAVAPPVPSTSGPGVASVASAAAVTCEGDGTTGNRVQVIYAFQTGGTDRYFEYFGSIRTWAAGADTIYLESARETGGARRIRYVTTTLNGECVVTVDKVGVSSAAMSSFGTMQQELSSRGYNRRDRKYMIFADAATYCGIGSFAGDDRKTADNRSNFGPSYGRTDNRCWGASTPAHELGHNLGAVSNNAPNTSGGAHCVDEYDVMCYSDSPNYPQMRYVCTDRAHDARLDCNHDDYYHTNPGAGNWLATHYNMADNTFLIRGAGGTPSPSPTATATASPTPTATPACDLPETYSGSLSGAADYDVQPNGTYFYTSTSGTHRACLTGPSGADFDLRLYKWNGSAWAVVARSEGPRRRRASATPVRRATTTGACTPTRTRGATRSRSGAADAVVRGARPVRAPRRPSGPGAPGRRDAGCS
ncbi:MAG: hypothetical protein M3Q27_07720, partial [Actinomycetota bacterium]|nr:hypothetical protein [Actinomycetota bacterium]